MTEPRRDHRLDGLEPDNLLAFLALLGLLRALETTRPEWRPRAAWDLDSPPLRPMLVLAEPQTTVAISEGAAEGAAWLATDYDFGGREKPDYRPDEARAILLQLHASASNPDSKNRLALWSSVLCEASVRHDSKSKQEKVEPTPLCLLGTGNTAFLKTLSAEARGPEPPRTGRGRRATAAASLLAALFAPWTRADETGSLRWDYADDRRHAQRWKAPTKDTTIGTQQGANRLAALALPLLPAVPASSGSSTIRAQVCGGLRSGGGFSFAWPVWRDPATSNAILAMLSHPQLREPGALSYLGVDHVVVSYKIKPTDYFAMTRATVAGQ